MTSAVFASTCIPGSGSPASAVDATTRHKNGAAMRPICLLFMMYSLLTLQAFVASVFRIRLAWRNVTKKDTASSRSALGGEDRSAFSPPTRLLRKMFKQFVLRATPTESRDLRRRGGQRDCGA